MESRNYFHQDGAVVTALSYSSRRNLLVAGLSTGMFVDTVSVYAWNLRTGKVTEVLTVHNGPVCGVDLHPDESLPPHIIFESCYALIRK